MSEHVRKVPSECWDEWEDRTVETVRCVSVCTPPRGISTMYGPVVIPKLFGDRTTEYR